MKMKYRIVFVMAALAVIICIAGISLVWYRALLKIEPLSPEIARPIQHTQEYAELSPETVVDMAEVAILPSPEDSQGVVAVTQADTDGQLLAVYGNGKSHRWDLGNLKSVAEFDFLSASPKGVNFSTDGTMVITPGRVVPPNLLNGYTVWDTRSGDILKCWGPHCEDGDPDDADYFDLGILLDPSGNWIVEYGGSAIEAEAINTNVVVIKELYDHGFNRDKRVSWITIDPSGQYLAYAVEEGQIKVYTTQGFLDPISLDQSSPPGKNIFVGSRTYGKYDAKAEIQTKNLAIDFTRTWLAWLNGENLLVWDMRRFTSSPHIEIPIANGSSMAFNQSGDLLAVGMDSGILIFDLEKGEKISQIEFSKVSSLYFTRDNRLLVYGDRSGTIHLWGVQNR